MNELMAFLGRDKRNATTPFLFCMAKDYDEVCFGLRYLNDQTGNHYDIEKLINEELFNLECLVESLSDWADFKFSPSSAYELLNEHLFDYSMATRCKFHEDLAEINCALGFLKRYCYLISSQICELYNITLTKNHIPTAKITSSLMNADTAGLPMYKTSMLRSSSSYARLNSSNGSLKNEAASTITTTTTQQGRDSPTLKKNPPQAPRLLVSEKLGSATTTKNIANSVRSTDFSSKPQAYTEPTIQQHQLNEDDQLSFLSFNSSNYQTETSHSIVTTTTARSLVTLEEMKDDELEDMIEAIPIQQNTWDTVIKPEIKKNRVKKANPGAMVAAARNMLMEKDRNNNNIPSTSTTAVSSNGDVVKPSAPTPAPSLPAGPLPSNIVTQKTVYGRGRKIIN